MNVALAATLVLMSPLSLHWLLIGGLPNTWQFRLSERNTMLRSFVPPTVPRHKTFRYVGAWCYVLD